MSSWPARIFWRYVPAAEGEPYVRVWHAHRLDPGSKVPVWPALCGQGPTLNRLGGQAFMRPPVTLRCPACDLEEMRIRERPVSLPPHLDEHAARAAMPVPTAQQRALLLRHPGLAPLRGPQRAGTP